MANYGNNNYSSNVYGSSKAPPFPSTIPITIELYDNNLGYKGAYQSGVGGFVGVVFTLDERGPVDFTMSFTGPQTINKTDIIKIKLFGNENYFFTGVVRTIPILGSTKESFDYLGFGLNDYLLRVNTENQSYITETLEYIVNDILDKIIVPKTPIRKNIAKLDLPVIEVTSLTVNYTQTPEVFDQLINLANSTGVLYHYGVDHTGEFFFKPKPLDTIVTLVVGVEGDYSIPGYEPEDEFEAVTKLYILDDNGILVTTLSTVEENDIFEQKVLAPQLGNPDIVRWGQGILAERETNRRRASIVWPIEPQEPTLLLGQQAVRVISNIPPQDPTPPNPNPFGSGVFGSGLFGGGQIQWQDVDDTLLVKEVTYTLTGSEATRSIRLGALPVLLDQQINKLRKSLIGLEINIGK